MIAERVKDGVVLESTPVTITYVKCLEGVYVSRLEFNKGLTICFGEQLRFRQLEDE